MFSKQKRLLAVGIILALLLALAIFGITGYWLPYSGAENTMPDECEITLQQQEDNSVLVTWPAGENSEAYLLEVLMYQNGMDLQTIFSTTVHDSTSCVIDALPADQICTIRIRSMASYSYPFDKEERIRYGEKAIEVTDCFVCPTINGVAWDIDLDTKEVEVSLDLSYNCTTMMYYVEDSSRELVQTLRGKTVTLQMGEDSRWDIPEAGGSHTFDFEVYRVGDGYTYYSTSSRSITLTQDDMLGNKLHLTSTSDGTNVYTLTWNKARGEGYLLQQWDSASAQWITLKQFDKDDERSYTTLNTVAYGSKQYRVVSLDGTNADTANVLVQSEAYTVRVGAALIGSTIWPIQDQKVYNDAEKSKNIGTAAAGTPYCVAGIENGMFRIRYENDTFGYISSDYCMINLTEFLGDLCNYNITNSYSAVYMIHEYDIDNITGELMTGYERVLLNNGAYLVPLLYPTALKLEQAALSAQEQGFRLKIYDSFRPQITTNYLYNTAIEFVQNTLPGTHVYEGTVFDGATSMTYEQYMTNNGKYALTAFLAKGTSRHNQGVAVDLTLEFNGVELAMQTAMHDLSWFSVTYRNNEAANLLRDIMVEQGFATLVSEWWHFQDDDSRNSLSVKALYGGVTPKCWMYDGIGWRYRTVTGKYVVGTTQTIDGTVYTFDSQGYVIE